MNNFSSRFNSVNDTSNERKLIRYALNDPSIEIRRLATSKIRNQMALLAIAKNESSEKIILEAINNIEDETILKELAICSSKRNIQSKIISKIYNVSDLIEIGLKNKRIFRDDILEQIKLIHPDINISTFGIKLHSSKEEPPFNNKRIEKYLSKEKYNDKYLNRIGDNVNDYEWLVNNFNKFPFEFRKKILEKTDNQKFLINLVENESPMAPKAIQKVKDESILWKYMYKYGEHVLLNPNFKNEEFIIDSLYYDLDPVRFKITKLNFNNQNVLFDIVCNREEKILIDNILNSDEKILTDKIDDEFLVEETAKYNERVTHLIEDQTILLDLALDDNETAPDRLDSETGLLFELLKKEAEL